MGLSEIIDRTKKDYQIEFDKNSAKLITNT